jgi:hypothetical protein
MLLLALGKIPTPGFAVCSIWNRMDRNSRFDFPIDNAHVTMSKVAHPVEVLSSPH